MSVHFYDKALITHFRDILDDNRIHILPVEQAIRFTAQLQQDNVKFPLISTTRLGYSIRNNDRNFAALHSGGYQRRTDVGTNVFAQIIPIRIEYQMDVFSVDQRTCDELIRELIFHITQHPTLTVEIPYILDTQHVFNIFLGDDIVDNSDTVEHVNRGVLFRNTLTLYTDDAYLFAGKETLQGKVVADVNTLDRE